MDSSVVRSAKHSLLLKATARNRATAAARSQVPPGGIMLWSCGSFSNSWNGTIWCLAVKVEGKENVDLYSASSRTPLTRSDMVYTIPTCKIANNNISVITCKHSPGGAATHIPIASSTYYSFIDLKRMNGWVGHIGWHTADGYPKEVSRQLHVMAQGRESSPVIDRRSNQLRYTGGKNDMRFTIAVAVKTGRLACVVRFAQHEIKLK